MPAPGPEAVLVGTWTITPADPGDSEGFTYQARFDSNGNLVEINGTRSFLRNGHAPVSKERRSRSSTPNSSWFGCASTQHDLVMRSAIDDLVKLLVPLSFESPVAGERALARGASMSRRRHFPSRDS